MSIFSCAYWLFRYLFKDVSIQIVFARLLAEVFVLSLVSCDSSFHSLDMRSLFNSGLWEHVALFFFAVLTVRSKATTETESSKNLISLAYLIILFLHVFVILTRESIATRCIMGTHSRVFIQVFYGSSCRAVVSDPLGANCCMWGEETGPKMLHT